MRPCGPTVATMLSLTLAFGIGADEPPGNDAARMRAVAEIEKTGGSVGYDEDSQDMLVISVAFWNSKATDSTLSHLRVLPELQDLRLRNAPITDAALENLRALKQLQSLILMDIRITDPGLESIGGLTELKVLSLDGNDVTNRGLDHPALCRWHYLGVC